MSECGLGVGPGDLPDAGQGACCIGAAVWGPARCTCWAEELDQPQADVQPSEPVVRPGGMCGDCAYRPNSPERTEQDYYAGGPEDLDGCVRSGQPFWCHDGMPAVARLVHPSGVTTPGHPAAYRPLTRDGVQYRADGRPAYHCAGWAARRRALDARAAR